MYKYIYIHTLYNQQHVFLFWVVPNMRNSPTCFNTLWMLRSCLLHEISNMLLMLRPWLSHATSNQQALDAMFFLKKLGFSCRSCEKRPGRTQLVFEHNLPVRVTNVTKTRTFFWSKWNLLNQKITAAPLRFMLNRRPVNGAPQCLWPLTTGKSVSAYESVDFVSIAHFLGKPKWGPKPKTTNRPKC